MNNVKKFYLVSVEYAGFINAVEESKKINSWVESQTNEKISRIHFPRALSAALPSWLWWTQSITKGSGTRTLIKKILKKEALG